MTDALQFLISVAVDVWSLQQVTDALQFLISVAVDVWSLQQVKHLIIDCYAS